MTLDVHKFSMDLYKNLALKIAEKEALTRNGYQQCIGAVNSANRTLEAFRIYKTSDLSNDKLDERKIGPDGHKLIIEGINKVEQVLLSELKEMNNRILVLKGQDQAFGLSLDLIEKLNGVSKARSESIDQAKDEITNGDSDDGGIATESSTRKIGQRPESLKMQRMVEDHKENLSDTAPKKKGKKKNGKNK